MKFLTKNMKIALTVLLGLVLLYWGINYLKGINILTPRLSPPKGCCKPLPSPSTVSRWDR